MTRRTPKQNYLGMRLGEKPDSIVYLGGYNPFSYGEGNPIQYLLLGPSNIITAEEFGGVDIWGVTWNAEESGGTQPDPHKLILHDVAEWPDVIKAPDFSAVDWAELAKSDLEANYAYGVSPTDTLISFWLHGGYVTNLTNFMGFSDALMAMLEDPDEVYDLFDHMSKFYCGVLEKALDAYKPDVYHMFDTYAGSTNSFYSVETYKELVLPFHMREAEIARAHGLPIEMHCAGMCADFIDAFEPLGISYWIGADCVNDIPAIMEKHPNLVVSGVWKPSGEVLEPDCPEGAFKQSVFDVLEQYGPTGRFAWFDNILAGSPEDEIANRKNAWLAEALAEYGNTMA